MSRIIKVHLRFCCGEKGFGPRSEASRGKVATANSFGVHTRLVPGHGIEAGARIVTFGNGRVVRKIIVTIDDNQRRVVWSAVGGSLTHHHGSAQVRLDTSGATTIVWIADFYQTMRQPL